VEPALNVPIRMLGIITSIIWIVLIAFIVSAVYSIKDLGFGFGEPQFAVASNHTLRFSLPMYINNSGYSSLEAFNITTVFSTADGSEISRASTFVPVISQGENVTIFHNATLSLDSLVEKEENYLFQDTNLTVSVAAGLNLAALIPTQLWTNVTYPWGAPFSKFMLGQPSIDLSNPAKGRVVVPLSFENHAAFDLTGNIKVQLYDSANMLLGESQTAFNTPSHSPFEAKLEFYVPLSAASSSAVRSGHFSVYFSSSLFEYGPLVTSYG
jgi:hypothetical protein